jgi:hypothetical protein
VSKVLYLDFDGVLHHENVVVHPRKGIYIAVPDANRRLFEWAPILEQLLEPHPDVGIVLSTSWARVRGFRFAKSQLSAALQERVVGATYHRRHMRREDFLLMPRGVQIVDDVFRRRPEAWFALDDDHIGWPSPYREKLVRTNGELGLSDHTVQVAVATMLKCF